MEQDDETALGAAPPRRESFAKSRASPLGAAAVVLILMVASTAAAYLHAGTWAALSWPARGWLLCGFGAFPLASLALLKARPAAYRRHACKLSCLHHLVLAVAHQLMHVAAALQLGLPALDSSTAAAATAAWLAILSVASGTNPGAMLLLCFQLPPVAMAASACCTAAALASMNARVCASDFLQHPESAWRLEAYYRWLEPLIAPIEPLLLATGLHREHSDRHCHCG